MLIDNRNVVLVCSIDLTAAFETVKYNIFFSRQKQIFSGYLDNRHRQLSAADLSSAKSLATGIPQWSGLGPLLYTKYTLPWLATSPLTNQ